ncbi:MAG: B12-binding domain-containing radical SAM protein [Elusimicrobia bacterium]|nr:B12-binding domain-containing radical SAM protein [Elusimicrobiota bacterium]
MKILFIFYNIGSSFSFHPGIQMLSSIAKKNGHQTKLLHLHESHGLPAQPGALKTLIERFIPDVIAFTATDFEYLKIEKLAGNLKKFYPKKFFILGGKSAILYKDLIQSPFDAFCVGEAEIEFPELLKKIEEGKDYTNVKSFHFIKDGKLIKNSLGEIVTDLDSLPWADYELFDTPLLLRIKNYILSVQFTRGCPYNCTYCFVTSDKKTLFQPKEGYGMKNYLRKRSVPSAIDELESLCNQYGKELNAFNLDDELPLVYKDWMKEFCRLYQERIYNKYRVEYILNGRIDLMTEELIKTLTESGCREVRLGLESGNYRIRKEILDKPITDENIRDVFRLCDQYSLRVSAFTMIGMPTESEETIWDTLRMTSEIKPYLVRLTFCYPFENTRLWDYVLRNNLLRKERYLKQSGYFEETVLSFDQEFEQKLMAYRFLFPWYVNKILIQSRCLQKAYEEALKKYEHKSFRDKAVREAILSDDKALSALCDQNKGTEHYCYFEKNAYYFHCKNKRVPRTKNND